MALTCGRSSGTPVPSHIRQSASRGGPSALDVGELRCEGMSTDEVQELPDLFATSAANAMTAGFSGVQIHAAHGFLLSQFLSPLFNRRTDGYGGSVEARCRVVIEVVNTVRAAVGSAFPIGIKINATDQIEGGLTQDDALEVVRLVDDTSVDLIDISGGTYFPGAKATSDGSDKGPYFPRLLHKSWHVVVTQAPAFRVARAWRSSPSSLSLLFIDRIALPAGRMMRPAR